MEEKMKRWQILGTDAPTWLACILLLVSSTVLQVDAEGGGKTYFLSAKIEPPQNITFPGGEIGERCLEALLSFSKPAIPEREVAHADILAALLPSGAWESWPDFRVGHVFTVANESGTIELLAQLNGGARRSRYHPLDPDVRTDKTAIGILAGESAHELLFFFRIQAEFKVSSSPALFVMPGRFDATLRVSRDLKAIHSLNIHVPVDRTFNVLLECGNPFADLGDNIADNPSSPDARRLSEFKVPFVRREPRVISEPNSATESSNPDVEDEGGEESAQESGDATQEDGALAGTQPVAARLELTVMTDTALADEGGELLQETPVDEASVSEGSFSQVLQFPFEDVLAQWQAGPPDPNFIREEVSVEVVGWEEVRTKTIFTKNPLPWLLKKTVIREEEFVFGALERVNMRERSWVSTYRNKVLEHLGNLSREARMRVHEQHANWTVCSHKLTANFTSIFGVNVKNAMESFAEKLFLEAARRNTDILENTLSALYAVGGGGGGNGDEGEGVERGRADTDMHRGRGGADMQEGGNRGGGDMQGERGSADMQEVREGGDIEESQGERGGGGGADMQEGASAKMGLRFFPGEDFDFLDETGGA